MGNKTFSEEELNTLSKDMIISLYLQLNSSFQLLSEQNKQMMKQNEIQTNALMKQISDLQEQLAMLTNYRFGRKSEKTADIIDGQYTLDLTTGEMLLLNDIESMSENAPDKTDEELLEEARMREQKKRKKGVREYDLRKVRHEIIDYKTRKEDLDKIFPEGYVEVGYDKSHRVEYKPAELTVIEERIYKYKSVDKNKFAISGHQAHLLEHSIVTPSLAAKIMYDKYINAVPINRISKELGWLDAVIRPATMSRWMINLTDKYLVKLYDLMKTEIKKAKLIHADETPFICESDRKKPGRSKNSKSYMWVYHTADQYGSPPIFIYDYHDNRRKENVEIFLKEYQGIIMADGYEPYHAVARSSNGSIVVAGCWAHLKRKFVDVIKTDPKNAVGTVAFDGNEQIAKIYHEDNKKKDASEEERLAYRQEVIKPLVDDFFEWAKEREGKVASEGTNRALKYAINQEKYLREFLNSGIIPLDNSDAERSIRSFCVGKHNWHIAASSKGAYTSGILYSIAETTKANGLKPYEYFKYLFEQLLEHENEINEELLQSLAPWSDSIPEELRATI